jgi:hypothetical protein
MQRRRSRILTAIAAIASVGALVIAALVVVPARATPSKDVTTIAPGRPAEPGRRPDWRQTHRAARLRHRAPPLPA